MSTPVPQIFFPSEIINTCVNVTKAAVTLFGWSGYQTIQAGTMSLFRVVKTANQDLTSILDAILVMPHIIKADLDGTISGITVPIQATGQEYGVRLLHCRAMKSNELTEMVTWQRSGQIADYFGSLPQLAGTLVGNAIGRLDIYRQFPVELDPDPPEAKLLAGLGYLVDCNAINISIQAKAPRYATS